MADNVSDQIKNFDQSIKDADKSLKNLLDTYNKFEAKANAPTDKGFKMLHDTATRGSEQFTSAQNKAKKSVEKTTSSIKEQKGSLESMLPTLRRLASAFGVAFSVQGLVNFGKKLVETRGEFELQQVAMRSILQNKQLADEIWDKTMQAALQSPFTAMQLTKYTKQLAAYRIETDKLFDTTKRLADVSAGLGVDMQRLILAYGQVKAANYLRASEIRQFTEAGVNILGELSTYLSKTRGEMISTAQVMDMVQKRMVTFEDVEAIFKRMTDEGGIFYNMQYVQSQTVKGQINKLHDAYDQMLNSIGKGNEGVLKDVVAALNNIVQNWRYWAAAIKSIAFGTIIASLTKLGVTLTGVNVAGIAAGKGMTKLAGGVKALGVALKGNWLTLAIGAVVSLAAELYNLNKRMKAVNAEIDEQNLNLFETKERLEGYQTAIEKNNKALEGSTGNEEKLKKKREENAEILAKLKNDYPQLAEGMEMQKNGVIDLTDALKKENEELERQITLNSLMKQSSIFDENLTKDAQDLSKAYINQQQQIIAARAQARSLMVQLKQRGAEGSNQYDILKQISEINPDDLQKAYKRLIELRHLLYNDIYTLNGKQPAPGTYQPLEDYYRNYLRGISNVSGSEKELGDEFNKLGEYIGYELEKGLESEYKEEIEKSGLSTLQWYALNVNKVQKDIDDGVVDIYRFLRDSLEKNGQAQGPGMQTFWNNIVKTNYIDPYFKAWKVGMEELEAGGWRFPMALPTESGMPNIFATPKKGGDTSETIIKDDDGSKAKKNASRLISLIREMRAEYDKLSKSAYGYAKSEEKVRTSFAKSYEAILKEAGVPENFDFSTNAGEIAALEKVRDYVKGNAKFAEDAWKDVQKVIDQLKTESEIEVQVRIREDFGRQMEEAFGNYELTLELQKLNLPKGLASEMWGIEETDLQDLRARLSEMYNGLRDENGQLYTDAFKDYEKFLNKIDELERKQQRERLKDYAKYLETQYSDRVKIEMEYIQKLSRLEAETAIPEAQKSAIREGLRKEFDEKSRKQDWEDFKGSEFYVEMMEDLEKQGTASLEVMRKKLLEMRANAENLSPRALKEVVNALEKIDEIERKRTQPLKRVRDAQKALEGVNMKEVYEELAINQEQLALSEEQERSMERAIMLIQKRNELEKQGYTIEEARVRLSQANQARDFAQSALDAFKSDGSKEAQDNLATLEQVLNKAKADVEKWQEIVNILSGKAVIDEQAKGNNYTTLGLSELQERRKNIKQSIKDLEGVIGKEEELAKLNKELNDAWDATYEAIKGWASSVQNVFDGVMDNVDYFSDSTYGMVTAWKEFGDTSVSALNDLVSGIQAYRKANAEAEKDNAATGLFTANGLQLALVVLGVLMKIVQAIAKQHDAALDKQIQKQQERIDALKDAYARLEKQIEKTWSSVSYMQTYEQQVQNIREQIDAMEAQMRAEEAKKNTDDNAVRQYQRDIQDAYDQLDELEQKSIEVFGGIGEEGYRSAAEGFVEAWKSAFLETGDGLQGLQDHFDEFLQDWFTKQATMLIARKYLDTMFDQIDAAVNKNGRGGVEVAWDEIQDIMDTATSQFPAFSAELEEFFRRFGGFGEGSLSGLAAGIQGMTEEQANILEAYWNSVRMYTASIDQNVAMIASALGVGGNSPSTNPQLQQLQLIAANTQATHQLLQSVTRSGHSLGGYGIKVFND